MDIPYICSMEVIHNEKDLILNRWDNNQIVQNQGPNLLKLLPNWSIEGKTNNNMLYSPLLTKGIDGIESELQKVYDAIQQLITNLNSEGKTISRIECWLHQSDDIRAINHPLNTHKVRVSKDTTHKEQLQLAHLNNDYKFSSWVFTDHFKDKEGDNIFGNRFVRQIKKNLKSAVKKKNYTLVISSAWSSI